MANMVGDGIQQSFWVLLANKRHWDRGTLQLTALGAAVMAAVVIYRLSPPDTVPVVVIIGATATVTT
jgi:hypothetical protein